METKAWKPEGYTSVAPYLITTGAQRVIDFLKAGFDATELRRYEDEHGRIMHAEVRIDDTVVMIADDAENWPALQSHLHVYVPDALASYNRSLQAGGESVQAPASRAGDPDLRGGVKDPSGNTWWISTQK
ncbi:MAG: VOC family protein [Gemmatimonadota bacterium]